MNTKWNFLTILALLAILVGSTASPVSATPSKPGTSPYPPAGTVPAAGLNYRLLAKAALDECFNAIGQPCDPDAALNKVNQAYVWGLTQANGNLWFGTAANVICLGSGLTGTTDPQLAESYVCEMGQSKYVDPVLGPVVNLDPTLGDWRPPEIWTYNIATGQLVNKTPNPLVNPQAYALIHQTVGLRAAGSIGNVVFIAGITLNSMVDLFAFRADTGEFIGATVLPDYINIRKMLAYNGVLYVAVGSSTGGTVLRWTGTDTAPFQFEVVSNLDADAAEIVAYKGRIVVSTWPAMIGTSTAPVYSGLWMSPVVPAGGLTNADATAWTKVFTITNYEPDPVVATTVAGGALAQFGDYLYWTTMQVPFSGMGAFSAAYGEPDNVLDFLAAFYNTTRPTIVFRSNNLGASTQKVEVLYGDSTLPVYNPASGSWSNVSNKLGATPLYGGAGYGNFYNVYTWSMEVYNNQLYAGTFDWSFVADEAVSAMASIYLGQPVSITLPNATYGADLFRFDSTKKAAKAISYYGVGNYLNYGIRNMLVYNGKLYLGSANSFNLATTASQPNGGWELIELSPR